MKFRIPWRFHHEADDSASDSAAWLARMDRGLTEDEEAELDERLSRDPGFREAFRKSEKAGELIEACLPELSTESVGVAIGSDRIPVWSKALSAAAVFALFGLSALMWWIVERPAAADRGDGYYAATRSTTEPWTLSLPDGSLARLNADSEISVSFEPGIRQVELSKGEAHFTVAKDLDRPFLVNSDGVSVQAVGTAFNLRRGAHSLEVLVTEGTVRIAKARRAFPSPVGLASPSPEEAVHPVEALLSQNQRAEIFLGEGSRETPFLVSAVESSEIQSKTRWQRELMMLGEASLQDIASSFERKTGTRLVIADEALQDLQIGGRFPSDDVVGFLEVLKSSYGIEWEELEDGALQIGGSRL